MAKEEKYGVGTIHENKKGLKFEIIEKIDMKLRKVKFLDSGYENTVSITSIGKGDIKDLLCKSVYSVGCYGVGEYISKINNMRTREYEIWIGMLKRCYDEKTLLKRPTYRNVTVCEEWLNFQNFAKWYKETYPYHIKNIKFDMDKDLKQNGIYNKIYSPETVVFLPSNVNTFISSKTLRVNNTSGHIGVSERNGSWVAGKYDFIMNKRITLGTFKEKEMAIESYNFHKLIDLENIKVYLRSLKYLPEETIQLIK